MAAPCSCPCPTAQQLIAGALRQGSEQWEQSAATSLAAAAAASAAPLPHQGPGHRRSEVWSMSLSCGGGWRVGLGRNNLRKLRNLRDFGGGRRQCVAEFPHCIPSCSCTASADGGRPQQQQKQHLQWPLRRQQQQATLERIRRSKIIACLHTKCADLAYDAARAALCGGVSVLEVTCTTPNAPQIIRALVEEFPDATLGAGTVLTVEDATAACEAGAAFLMSPCTDQELIREMSDSSAVFIPGAMTPTEILSAVKWGSPLVKLFPAAAAGGEDTIRAMARICPQTGLIPARQISASMVVPYLQAGAAAVVLSGAIFSSTALANRNLAEIQHLANSAVSLVCLNEDPRESFLSNPCAERV